MHRRLALSLPLAVLALGALPAASAMATHPEASGADSAAPTARGATGGGAGEARSAHSSCATVARRARALKRGMRGRAVARLQRRLRVTADGAFGSVTERAVKRFQRRRGLEADGVVGRATARALRIRLPVAYPAHYPRYGTRCERGTLYRIAICESGGNPRAVSRNGMYRGKYQFDRATWRSVGGSGDPAAASEREQDLRALKLLRARGTSPWPSCGR